MASLKQSDLIREIVAERYVKPALRAGLKQFSVRVRDVLRDAEATEDFPRGRTPMICEVLQGRKLLDTGGLAIERVDGPPSKQSRTVVVHYRVVGADAVEQQSRRVDEEDSQAWAERLTGGLHGLLREEIAAFGGADALIRWIRSDEGEEE